MNSQTTKLDAEIAHLTAQTIKLNKEVRWYEIVVIASATLAVVAVVKLFL